MRGRAGSSAPAAAAMAKPAAKDPHTLDREARDRERLLKEAQRITRLAGMAGSKRGRGADDDGAGGERKSRRESRRGGGGGTEGDDEQRMSRLEAERERGR